MKSALDALATTECQGTEQFFGIAFSDCSFEETVAFIANRAAAPDFCFVVTPNVQHAVHLEKSDSLGRAYKNARIRACDSQIIRGIGRLFGRRLPIVRGSDLTAHLFENVFEAGDKVRVLCSSTVLAQALARRFDTLAFDFHVPPGDLSLDGDAFQEAVDFVANGKGARATFVCIGMPKSELISSSASTQAGACGTALCTGASLEFLVGRKKRAPQFMQDVGLEWLHRMASEPRRLVKRYASDFPTLFRLAWREFKARR